MYRFLISAIIGIVLSLMAYLQLEEPSRNNYLISAFLFLIFLYFSFVCIMGFWVARSIKKMQTRKGC